MQEIIVVLVVLVAVSYLMIRAYKSLFTKKSGCELNCGCDPGVKSPVLEQLQKKIK